MIFLDASIVVAYYLKDSYSEQAQEVIHRNEMLYLSDLVEIEVFSVLSRLVRVGSMDIEIARQVGTLFGEHLEAGLYTRMHLQPEHYRWARDTIARFDLPLKSRDALHLAAARVGDLTLITADRQLARNAGTLNVSCQLIEP